jgi:lipopolysaccharide export system permease protein
MIPGTLSRYIARLYLEHFGLILLVVTLALLISNTFDTLNRFRSTIFTLGLFIELISLKLPYLVIEIVPLVGFISALFFLYNLTRHQELISIFNTGISIWNILLPMISASIIIGCLSTAVLQPIASILIGKYDILETKLLKRRIKQVTISNSGVIIAEDYQNQRRMIVARSVDTNLKELGELTLLFIDRDNNFISRIDAKSAFLDNGMFRLRDVTTFAINDGQRQEGIMDLPTSLSIGRFTEGLLSPEHVSFWQLPKLISKLQETGVPASRYQIYYYKQVLRPLMMAAVCFMAACFTSMRHHRNSGAKKIGIGILSGFIIYLASEISVALLIHNGFGILASSLCPSITIILLSIFMILHLHETG